MSALLEKIEETGLVPDIYSDFTSKQIAELLGKGVKAFEIRRAIAPAIPKLLGETVERYKERFSNAETPDEKNVISGNIEYILASSEKYNRGGVITIDDILFYDPTKLQFKERHRRMCPILNSVGSGVFWAGLSIFFYTLPLAFTDFNAEYINPVQNGLIYSGIGLKFLVRSYKDLMNIKGDKKFNTKKYLQHLQYLLAGAGGISFATPYIFSIPYVVLMYTIFSRFFRTIGKRERITEPLPSFQEVRDDLLKKIDDYKKIKDKYRDAEFRRVERKNFDNEANLIDIYLRYHLTNITLNDIYFDWDYVTGRVLGATARADVFTDTAEFSAEKMKNMTSPLFAKVYAHEVAHLDGVINEGRANFRADKVLEDMIIHKPDEGYDLQMERDMLISVGHAYALMLQGEHKELYHKELSHLQLKEHLIQLGLHEEGAVAPQNKNQLNINDPLHGILGWASPNQTMGRKILLRVQSITGGSNPNSGYTIDHYKLLKRDGMI